MSLGKQQIKKKAPLWLIRKHPIKNSGDLGVYPFNYFLQFESVLPPKTELFNFLPATICQLL